MITLTVKLLCPSNKPNPLPFPDATRTNKSVHSKLLIRSNTIKLKIIKIQKKNGKKSKKKNGEK